MAINNSTYLDFYFEFYSPYGYLASLRIEKIAEKHGHKVNWRPFMLGPTFAITGHQPLLGTPMMGEYSERDLYRSARLQKAEFKMPKEFPKASLNCARAFFALVDDYPQQAILLAKAIYHSTFGLGLDGTQLELISQLADEIGVDGNSLIKKAQSQEIKDRLKIETQTAIDRGVFGSPYVIVDNEPFWGNDRLDHLDRWLETGGW